MEKKWLIRPADERCRYLSQTLNISEVTAKILIDRGISSIEAAQQFLYPDLKQLHSPLLLPDMDKAVRRIAEALADQESITIYGDYDVDGQTSVVLLLEVLRSLVPDPELVQYYIPNRMDEGYGLHQDALKEISAASSLVITVDCGITACAEAEFAKNLGLDLIITDHHEPKSELPQAAAVINPKRSDSRYPFSELAGVGVAYKLVQALGEYYDRDFSQYLDLVALGTVSDLVPLVDENRIFVKFGLKQLELTERLGLAALIRICNLKAPYKAADLGFKLGPRLNAVGRMGESARGVELLLSRDRLQAQKLAETLDYENRVRQETEAEIFEEAVAMIEANNWKQDAVIVVAKEDWHPGVIGIVASRIVDRYYRPTIVISLSDGVGKGSARSISGFNLYNGLRQVSDLLVQFGGHEMAAGLTVQAERISELRARLNEIAASSLQPEDLIPKVRIDYQLNIKDINHQLLREFELLEPFGMGNPTPVLQISGSVLSTKPIGIDRDHLRCIIQDHEGEVMEAVGFGMYQKLRTVDGYRENVDFAVYPQPGYRDPSKIELIVRDFQVAQAVNTFIEEWMLERYPWQLPESYNRISHLHEPFQRHSTIGGDYNIIDSRNVWDKNGELRRWLDPQKKVLIYAASPARVLDVCRELRIAVPNGANFIGFEHELLTAEEREQLLALIAAGTITWVVSTGIWQPAGEWEQIALYDAVAEPEFLFHLLQKLGAGGDFLALFGRRDCSWLQGQISCLFPDRDLLARFYIMMMRAGTDELSYAKLDQIGEALKLTESVDFIVDVFAELDLIKKSAAGVKILPKPAQKLDLCTSVLYNRGKTRREQISAYLQHCLERGFLDELKRENTSY
ncbi:MAG: single-stranded-DNA-specific exonuclease RecJ [Firmicutes bacterium]|nr:single-stranded-DNA-specific exonuclease RecJ [Bacillota bacterium]